MATQINNSEMTDLLRPNFVHKADKAYALATIYSFVRSLPGLVGFWPMSSSQRSTGNTYDLSGQNRTLSYNGNPTYNVDGLVPYISLDGTGDYLHRSDETDLDILGTETIYNSASRGLVMGGWFYLNTVGSAGLLGGKWTPGGNLRSYQLSFSNTGVVRGNISSNGTAVTTVNGSTVTAATWFFAAMRFVPSTSLDIMVNGVISSNTTSIPAAIYNSTAALYIWAEGGLVTSTPGRASMFFLSANTLSDSTMNAIYRLSLPLFS